MPSAAELKLARLFMATKAMVPQCPSLIEMGWTQPKSPLQTDNSTVVGIADNTIVTKLIKLMDMHLWWIRYVSGSMGKDLFFLGPWGLEQG